MSLGVLSYGAEEFFPTLYLQLPSTNRLRRRENWRPCDAAGQDPALRYSSASSMEVQTTTEGAI